MESTKIIELPGCVQRFGRMYEQRMVITCGRREVSADYCMGCGGFNRAMIKGSFRK